LTEYSRKGHWRTLLDGTRTWVTGHHVSREHGVTHGYDADVFKRRADDRAASQEAVVEKKRKADLAAKGQKKANRAAKQKQKDSILAEKLAEKKERRAAIVAMTKRRKAVLAADTKQQNAKRLIVLITQHNNK
jgi:hypothetical protein